VCDASLLFPDDQPALVLVCDVPAETGAHDVHHDPRGLEWRPST
jgi:hypothetical protein